MRKTSSRLARSGVAAAVMLGLASVPAHAGTSVSIGGDTNWTITAKATTSADSVVVGGSVKGTANIVYDAHFLGIPLPVKGYYVNSHPYIPMKLPVLNSSNADLYRLNYIKYWNSKTGAYSWEVRGNSSFWGDKSVTVAGTAKGDIKGTTGFFLSGTYPCGSGCTHANAIVRISVK
ncbi:MAG: hypothetical protein ABIZ07_05315 [Dermatophilaceae bacterium]